MRIIASFLALFLFLAPAAQAASIDDAGAAVLKNQIDDFLKIYTLNTSVAQQGLSMSGPVAVVPKKDFYEVTLPGTKLVSPSAIFDIGNIALNVRPGKDGEYLASMALPPKMIVNDPINKEAIAEIALGSQKFASAWYPALGAFPKVDAEYKNITITGKGKKPYGATISAMKTVLDLAKNADNTWSGKQVASLDGLKMNVPAPEGGVGQNTFNLASSTITTTYDKMDLVRAQQVRNKLRALYKDGATPSADDVKALAAEMAATGEQGFLNGTTSDVSAKDLTVQLQLGSKRVQPPEPVVVKLASVNSRLAVNGMREEIGSSNGKLSFDGLSVTGVSDMARRLIPTTGKMELDAAKLPIRDISRAMTEMVTKAVSADLPADAPLEQRQRAAAEAEKNVTDTTNRIMEMLMNAGSVLSIRNTELKAPDVTATLNGDARVVKSSAPEGGTAAAGKMVYALEGIDEMVAAGSKTATGEQQAYIQALTFLQMMGQPGKTAAGKSLRSYTFELTPGGQFTLNGAPIDALAQMLKGFSQR